MNMNGAQQLMDSHASGVGVFMMYAAVVFVVVAIPWVCYLCRQDIASIRKSAIERAKGVDLENLKNPINVAILLDFQNEKEKLGAHAWKTKATAVLGKEVVNKMVVQALYAKCDRECPSTPSIRFAD
jgi:hypothetical protein